LKGFRVRHENRIPWWSTPPQRPSDTGRNNRFVQICSPCPISTAEYNLQGRKLAAADGQKTRLVRISPSSLSTPLSTSARRAPCGGRPCALCCWHRTHRRYFSRTLREVCLARRACGAPKFVRTSLENPEKGLRLLSASLRTARTGRARRITRTEHQLTIKIVLTGAAYVLHRAPHGRTRPSPILTTYQVQFRPLACEPDSDRSSVKLHGLR
jgi:hypothetical protein